MSSDERMQKIGKIFDLKGEIVDWDYTVSREGDDESSIQIRIVLEDRPVIDVDDGE